jgi:hypothetical protein
MNVVRQRSLPTSTLVYLNDSGTSNNVVISGHLVALGEDDVALSSNALRDGDSELAITHRFKGCPDGSGNGDEGGHDVGRAHVEAGASHEVDLGAGHHGAHVAHGQSGEGLHGEGAVGAGAGNDEGGGHGVDLVEVKGVVEGLGVGLLAEGSAQVGAVAGFHGQDAAGGCEVGIVHDGGSGSEVGADTDA